MAISPPVRRPGVPARVPPSTRQPAPPPPIEEPPPDPAADKAAEKARREAEKAEQQAQRRAERDKARAEKAASKESAKTAKAAAKAAAKADPNAPKKKKPIKPIAGVLVLLLVAHVVMGKVIKPHYSAAHPPAPGIIEGLGGITTNLADGHLAQISVSMQATKALNTKKFATDESALVGETVSIIGAKTYGELLSPSGRALLQSQLLTAYQKELGLNEGGQQVTSVFFTSFVLQ